jgi:hypothetical protein
MILPCKNKDVNSKNANIYFRQWVHLVITFIFNIINYYHLFSSAVFCGCKITLDISLKIPLTKTHYILVPNILLKKNTPPTEGNSKQAMGSRVEKFDGFAPNTMVGPRRHYTGLPY